MRRMAFCFLWNTGELGHGFEFVQLSSSAGLKKWVNHKVQSRRNRALWLFIKKLSMYHKPEQEIIFIHCSWFNQMFSDIQSNILFPIHWCPGPDGWGNFGWEMPFHIFRNLWIHTNQLGFFKQRYFTLQKDSAKKNEK